MKNDEASKTEQKDAELAESDLEQVAGGVNDPFSGQYVVTGVTHTARVAKVEALVIKQKVVE